MKRLSVSRWCSPLLTAGGCWPFLSFLSAGVLLLPWGRVGAAARHGADNPYAVSSPSDLPSNGVIERRGSLTPHDLQGVDAVKPVAGAQGYKDCVSERHGSQKVIFIADVIAAAELYLVKPAQRF